VKLRHGSCTARREARGDAPPDRAGLVIWLVGAAFYFFSVEVITPLFP
jgi:hypothetical protein